MESKFERFLYQVAVAFLAILALLFVASDAIPEPKEPEPSCSCAGKEGCRTATFDVDGTGDRLAYCALWGKRSSCCMIEPPPVTC